MGFQLNDLRDYFNRKNRMKSLGIIHSLESFRMVLERERARTDRTGHIFSLILFNFNHGKGTDAVLLEQLGTVLVQKVRMSDEVGWFDEGKSIGTLLPGTDAEGASQFVGIIRRRIGEAESNLVSTIYTYPILEENADHCVDGKEACDTRRSNSVFSSSATADSPHGTANMKTAVRPIEVLYALPYPIWKRMADFFGAILLLILLSPVFLLVAFFIKLVSPGPVIYRQERIGYMKKPFTFLKFRTMHLNNNTGEHRRYLNHLIQNNAPMTKLDDKSDDRIIPFGKFLRYSCLDELPQLINVLKGDMSLVGPRPCLRYEAEEYSQWHNRRFDTVPGMTGLWQVSGKNRLTFKEMIRLDIRYSWGMSFWTDARILLRTGPAIFGFVSEPISRLRGDGLRSPVLSPSKKG